MWNRELGKHPVASFSIPPHAPEAVAAAYEEFDRLGDEYGRLRGDIQDLRDAVGVARAADVRAVADAAAAGKPVKDANANEKKAQAELDAAEARLPGVMVALDEAGNTLAVSIAEHRSEWLNRLAEVRDEAASEYEAALSAALAAIKRFTPAQGAVQWLEAFQANLARLGRVSQFSGGKVAVRRERWDLDANTTHVDPAQLLELARKATKTEAEQIDLARQAVRAS